MAAEIAEIAHNKWPGILQGFGLDPSYLSGKHGPCPMCEGRDRFRFINRKGDGFYVCNSCGSGDGAKLAMAVTGMSFRDVADRIRAMVGDIPDSATPKTRDPAAITRSLESLWGASRLLNAGDEAVRYLAARGLTGPFSADLRFVPDCAVRGHPSRSRLPAMVAMLRAPDGTPATIHRTYLENGGKARMDDPRRMMPGTIPKGSAIRLAPYTARLGVAEGIETALAASARFGIPCWSAVNAQMMREFEWPANITELHIFGDNDAKFAGQAAAYHLAHRAATARAPIVAHVHIPPEVGTDWADNPPLAVAS